MLNLAQISRATIAQAPHGIMPRLVHRTGFALSGGGAKGSFEVGALKYLMQASAIRPDVITCTSVGSVNGMKLAEGEGAPLTVNGKSQARGLAGLEAIWLSFESPSQMYGPGAALAQFSIDYYTAIPMLLTQIGNQIFGKAVPVVIAGAALPTFLGPAAFPFLPFLDNGQAETEIKQLLAVADASSLFTLAPIAALYEGGNPDKRLIAGSGIELIFATVGLTSGALRYVRLVGLDHQGTLVGDLVERDQVGSPIPAVGSLSRAIDMKLGMLASAAAPIMFEPQHLTDDLEIYTDGGVRELVPVQAAIERGARRVFAIDCNAPYPAVSSQAPHQALAPRGLGALSLDVLAILLDEVDRDDVAMPPADVAWVWHILPLFEVEGDMEIDAGAIRVNIDYGYMCAFDAVDGSVRNTQRRQALRALGERIAIARRDISDRERCLHWVIEAWRTLAQLAAKNPSVKLLGADGMKAALVEALRYHRFPDQSDRDMNVRIANLTDDLDVGAGYTPPMPKWGSTDPVPHYIDEMISDKPPAPIDRAAALKILQDMKRPLQPLYDARTAIAGPRSVPRSRTDQNAPDRPWLRWERAESEGFFGNVWPTAVPAPLPLEPPTLTSTATFQIEPMGTSGWAAPSMGEIAGATRVSAVQLLVPRGQELLHVSGVFDTVPKSALPWSAPSGAHWATTWQMDGSPIALGAAAKAVSCCALPYTNPPLAAIVRASASGGDILIELAFDMNAPGWKVIGPVAIDGVPLTGVTGSPCVLMTAFAQQQSLELLVPMGQTIGHYCRDLARGGWQKRSDGMALSSPAYAISCFQGNDGAPANLEAVVGIGTGATTKSLEAHAFDAWNGTWGAAAPIVPEDGAIEGITGDPMVFQSKAGWQGDFELLVPAGGAVLHLFRDNDNGATWKRRGNGIAWAAGVAKGGPGLMLAPTPVAVSGYQSIDGVVGSPNLEAIVRLQSPVVQTGGDSFEAIVFDPAKQAWTAAGAIVVNGAPLTVPATVSGV